MYIQLILSILLNIQPVSYLRLKAISKDTNAATLSNLT